MEWLAEHRKSEILASHAEVAAHQGDIPRATALYSEAADAERLALAQVGPDLHRTYGIIAVSAASLLFKSDRRDEALVLARGCLGDERTPPFATKQLDELIGMIGS